MWQSERDSSPALQNNSAQEKKKTLKREARVSFHSEAGGAGLMGDHGKKLHSCDSG